MTTLFNYCAPGLYTQPVVMSIVVDGGWQAIAVHLFVFDDCLYGCRKFIWHIHFFWFISMPYTSLIEINFVNDFAYFNLTTKQFDIIFKISRMIRIIMKRTAIYLIALSCWPNIKLRTQYTSNKYTVEFAQLSISPSISLPQLRHPFGWHFLEGEKNRYAKELIFPF